MANAKAVRKNAIKTVTIYDENLGEEVKYKMAMDLNAMAELEEIYGDIETAFKQLESNKFRDVRNFIYACMKSYQEDITIQDVGRILTVSNIQEFGELLNSLAEASTAPADPNQVSPVH